MALKALHKPAKKNKEKIEKKVSDFIAKGGTLATPIQEHEDDTHRLTIRIPKWLLAKVDTKRKERVGKISRNLWILEVIEKATKK